MIEFDEKDAAIRDERAAKRAKLKGPLVGDWVIFADGVKRRFSHNWGDSLQTANDGTGFYMNESGRVDFSGALYPGVPLDTLENTGKTEDAVFWFFHHDYWGAGRGVYFSIPVTVWRCKENANV